MGTAIARILGCLSIHNISLSNSLETWSFFLSVISLVIALLALFFSVFWNWFAGWRKEITIHWTDLAADRIDLWQTLDKTYEAWTNPIKGKCTRLGILLKYASIPERLKCDSSVSGIDQLIEDLKMGGKNDITEWQKTLFQLCKGIWDRTIKLNGPLSLPEYGKICSKLTWALDGWMKMCLWPVSLSSRKYLLRRFGSDWALLTILTYLELSLKDKIRERWSDRSGLFRLAYKVNNQREQK